MMVTTEAIESVQTPALRGKARAILGACLLAAVFASALAIVIVRHEGRKLSIELTGLEQERGALNDDWGRLQLEQATVRTPAQVESLARDALSMTVPSTDDVVLSQ